MKIIAVDFDGTLCENKWPEIGRPNFSIINTLISMRSLGYAKLILWTCREGDQLDAALNWCQQHGLEFDAVNDNLQEQKEKYGNDSRKVSADEYWDDRGVLITFCGGDHNV